MGKRKIANILEEANCRGKWIKICDSEVLICKTCGTTFDVVVFKLILGSFAALVSKLPET